MANLDEGTIHNVAEWMEKRGYSFDKDKDGFWFEEYVQEHRWCEVFELMVDYALEAVEALDTPTEPKE